MAQHYALDPVQMARHHRANRLHALVLSASLIAIFSLVGFLVAGLLGLVMIAGFAALALSFGPRFSQDLLLKFFSASPLRRESAPLLHDLVDDLAARARLRAAPKLYYIPSRLMLAFTVGRKDDCLIALSDGLLRRLTGREIAGVLGHELSHIAHGDLKLMALADFVTKMTRTLVLVVVILAIINLPYMTESQVPIPWGVVLLLAAAPAASLILQLGLSRAREYYADLGAAGLTGDPEALATALWKMDAQQRTYWEKVLGRGALLDQPSLLRSHPATEERVRRLAEVARREKDDESPPDDFLPSGFDPVEKPPRRRISGYRF